MDIRKIKKLIDLIDKTGVSEIEIKEGDEIIRINSQKNSILQGKTLYPADTTIEKTPVKPLANQKTDELEHIIKSPMVGTIYMSSAPDTDPFVQVGQTVEAGTTLCVIEAMKMYNEIEANKAGTIKARLVENGSPVEYGQPLFIIE